MNQPFGFYLTLTYGRRFGESWGKNEGIFRRGYRQFQVVNHLISTSEGDNQKVMPLMNLFSSPPPLNVEPFPRVPCLFAKVLTVRLVTAACRGIHLRIILQGGSVSSLCSDGALGSHKHHSYVQPLNIQNDNDDPYLQCTTARDTFFCGSIPSDRAYM